jgi:hypothetical protein
MAASATVSSAPAAEPAGAVDGRAAREGASGRCCRDSWGSQEGEVGSCYGAYRTGTAPNVNRT